MAEPPTRARLVALALTGALALAGCGAATTDADQGPISGLVVRDADGLHGSVLPDPYTVAPVALRAVDGSSYTLATDARADLTLVFFGYTNCPDICQVVMADLASALTRLEPAQRARVDVQFVTTDPARDDEAALAAYLPRFDPGFGGLTGPLRDVVELGESVGVMVARGRKLPSGGYEVQHDTPVLGVLPDGTAPLVWTQPSSAELLAEDIAAVLADGVPDLDAGAESS